MVLAGGSLVGCAVGAWCADRFGRKPTIIGASVLSIVAGAIYPYMVDPVLLLGVGFVLIVGIYVLTAVLYGVYTTELFPTEVRLRANGLCNMLGRGATVVSPFIVLALFKSNGVGRRARPDDRPARHPDHRRGDLGHRDEPSRPGRARGCRATTGIGVSKRDHAFDGDQS